jgi:predicted RNase H-like nuclease
MTTILGIDAAWTAKQPSGVALVQKHGARWRCIFAAPSYMSFIERADGRLPDWTRTSIGSSPDPESLLHACAQLAREPAALITLDMPVATTPIVGRRVADREVSRTFGAQWCSAHSPGPVRPGSLGAQLSRRFAEVGYPIATAATPPGTLHRLVEVYPHPALLTLLRRDRRVPYKVGKASTYWKGAPIRQRIERLLAEFAAILDGLATRIDDIAIPLPEAAEVRSLAALKPFEDAIDALVCCYVGCEYLAGRCHPLGDETAAVWCPYS